MRFGFLFRTALLLTCLTPLAETAAGPTAPAEQTVGGIALGRDVHVRRRANSLTDLVARSKPTLVCSPVDFLWIEADGHGKPLFALNHAYQTDAPDPRGRWALLEADPGYVADGFVDFTRHVTAGTLLARDRYAGTLYLLEWPARHTTGDGPIDATRHLLVLRTPAGIWRFVAEGIGATDARSDVKRTTTDARYDVEWTRDPAAPLIVRATRATRILFESETAKAAIESRRDFVVRGTFPARFVPAGEDYFVARAADTPDHIARQLATCATFYPHERDPRLAARMLQTVSDALRSLNPRLAPSLRAGSRVLLPNPESLWDDANHAAGIRNHPKR